MRLLRNPICSFLSFVLLVVAPACGRSGPARSGAAATPGPVEFPHGDSLPLPPVEIPGSATSRNVEIPGSATPQNVEIPGSATAQNALVVPVTCPSSSVNMKVLVLSADGKEADLPAITDSLDYLGMPYDRWVLAEHGFQLPTLSSGCAGSYAGVMLTTDGLGYSPDGSTYASALTAAQWAALVAYETTFGVREVAWYSYPSTANGFAGPPTSSISTVPPGYAMSLTAAGQSIFYYLKTTPIYVQYAYAYLAPAAATSTVLLSDSAGNALALTNADGGRERLLLTFDNNAYLKHSVLLGTGLVHWVTSGLYLGEYRGRFVPQIDDLFIADELWDPSTLSTSTTRAYRMTATDFNAAANWQAKLAAGVGVKLAWAFNGMGVDPKYGGAGTKNDPLTRAAAANIATTASFSYINHTFEHWNLDGVDSPTQNPWTSDYCGTGDLATLASCELRKDVDVAVKLGIGNFAPDVMVSPDVSGLANASVLESIYQNNGMRYMVSDTSKVGYGNPYPNCGLVDPAAPSMRLVPRHPTNLFYNVSTTQEWVSEYNCFYATTNPSSTCYCNPASPGSPGYDPAAYADPTSRCYLRNSLYWPSQRLCQNGCTYSFILDKESDVLATYLLKGDIDPLMFHQANVRAYSKGKSLLSDLIDATLAKVTQYYAFPVTSPQMQLLGDEMFNRLLVREGAVAATLTLAGTAKTLTFANLSATAAKVQVTGLCNAGAVTVAGKCVGSVDVPAGGTVQVAVP